MAEGLNPDAPANNNVAADAIKSLDVSSLFNYDDNTSLDDIAGNYTNLGNQIGGIADNAAADVGMRQNSLLNNDFGATNPLMYHTYYEPAQTDFKSAMRVAGTQKALEVGMERGKAAAEAAAEEAQNNYNNAYSAYENFRNAVSNPTLATVDTSLLGEGNEVGEAQAIQDFAGQSKEDAVNSNLGNLTWSRANVDWSNSETWATAASDAINNFGVRDQYDSWSDEERQAFWDRKDVGAYFSNDYTERYIYNTMGQESVDKYKESVAAVKSKLENTWDYLNSYTDTLDLEPIPLITVTNEAQLNLEEKSFQTEFLRETGANDVANYRKEEWIRENVEEQYQDEVIAKAKEQQEAFNQRWKEQGVSADNSELKAYQETLASEYLDFISNKVKQGTTNSKGQAIQSYATTEDTDVYSKEVSDSMGFDIDTLRWYKSMKTEHPEELNVLMNQIAQAYGQANTLEVADGEKYYYVNGKYVQPEAGSVILFSMPGVIDNDGNIIDKDYEKFVSCFKDLNDSTANRTDEETKNLETAMQESWQKYYTRLVTAEALESMTGTTMDADMYSAVLYRSDPSTYKDATINGKKISDLVAEFKSTVESNGHEAYVRLGNLAQKAYSYLGFMYGKDADGNLVQYNLEIGDTGMASTGQVGDDNNYYSEYTPAQAMALYSVITTSINEYQAGNNTDTNINPSFLDDDSAGWFADFGDSFLDFFTMMFDWAGALIASGVAAIGNNFLPEEKRGSVWDAKGLNIKDALASIWPGNWGQDYWSNLTEGESVNDLLTGTPKEGTLDYFTSFSNLQQQNLADMINPLLIESWFPDIYKVEDDGSNVPGRIGEGYTSRVAGADDNPLDVYGLSTMFANWTGFKESSAKLLGALAGGYVAGFATTGVKVLAVDAAKGIGRAASNLTETIKASYTANKIVNSVTAEQLAERTAGMTAVKLAEQQAAKSTFETAGALGTGATAGSLGAEAATGLTKVAEQSAQRGYMSGIASVAASDNLENLTEGFATEFISRAGYKGATKAATTEVTSTLTQEASQGIALGAAEAGTAEGTELAAKAMAAESIQRATLSLGTGLPEAAFEAMDAKTQRFFCKAFNSVINGNVSGSAKSLSGQAFLRSIGTDGIKNAAEAVANATKAAAAKGLSWGMEDTFRVLAQQGWDGASTRMLLKDFAIDFATDMVRDNIRNLSNPYLTNDGWQRQSIEEYFTNPYTYIQNLLMSGIQFGIQRGKAQVIDAVGTKKFYKYRDAYNSAGDRETADLYLGKMVKWSNIIEKNANKLMRKGVPYAQTRKIHDEVNTELNKAFDQSFTISDFDPSTGEYTKRMRTADEFSDFLKKTKLNTQERTAMAARYAVISFQDDYITNKAGLGERATQLGGNFDNDLNLRIWELEEEVRAKYYDSVKADDSLDEYQKNQKMYKLYTDAIVDKYGNQVEGLRASLEYMYGKYLDKFQERKTADPNYKWRLGYTSNNSLYSAECDDVTAFGGSWGGRTIDRDASDINKPRDVETKDLLNAIKNGDDVYELKDEKGNVIKTYKLNPNGLNFLRRMTAYDNANTVHRFFSPIFGDNLQGREHLDTVNMALASARNFDAVVVGTKAARAAATNDGARAQAIIDEMRGKVQQKVDKVNQAGRSKAENTAYYKAEAQMEKNRNWNAEHEEIIYKKAQDAQAAKDYFDRVVAEKHGALKEKYKNTVQNILDLEGELGEFTAKQEYKKASGLASTLVKAYSAGEINSTDKRTLTANDGTTKTVIDLSDTTLDLVKRSASNNQEYSADLVVSLMDDYYASYGRKPQSEITTAERKTAYAEAIDTLNQDSKANSANFSRNEYQKKVLMREAYTKYGINLYKKGKTPEGYAQGGTSKKVVSGYDKEGKPIYGKTIGKGKEDTSVYDTTSTGFTIDGKPLLSKYAGDYGYNFDKDGSRVGRADETIDMVTKPIRTTLADEKGNVSQATERMIASSVSEAETYLKDENTADKSSGSEGVQVTPNKLAITLNKVLPDAELYFEAEHSGLIKTLQLLDKQGISADSYGMVMRRAITENPDMPISDRNDLIKASLFLDLMANDSSRATMAVGSIDAETKGGSAFSEIIAATDTVDGEHVGITGKKQEAYARVYGETSRKLNQHDRTTVQSCMESLQRASELVNVGGKYESKIMKDRESDLSQARDVTKAAAKDFGKLAKSYYDKAVAEPTEANSSFVQSAKSFAEARAGTAAKNNAKASSAVTEADCMHALGVARYEEIISPYGNKNGQTYPEYLAARNNTEGYKWNVEEGYSSTAADAYKLGSNNFGNHLEQMFNGAQRLATMFPEDSETLLKKADEYQTTYVAPQYQTDAQKALGVSRTLNSIIGKSSLDDLTYTSSSTLGGTKTTGFTPEVVREFANVIKGIDEAEAKFNSEKKTAKNFDYALNRKTYLKDYQAGLERLNKMYKNTSAAGVIDLDEFVATIRAASSNLDAAGYGSVSNVVNTGIRDNTENTLRSVLAKVVDEATYNDYTSAVDGYNNQIKNFNNLKKTFFEGTDTSEIDGFIKEAEDNLKNYEKINTETGINLGKKSFFTGEQLTDLSIDRTARNTQKNYMGSIIVEAGGHKFETEVTYEMGGDAPEITFRENGRDIDITNKDTLRKSLEQNNYKIPDNPEALIIANGSRNTAAKAKEVGGIDTLRHPDENGMHYGNPFSPLNNTRASVKVDSIADSVVAYEKWLRGWDYADVEPERRQWIVDKIASGELVGKPLVYYTDYVPGGDYFGGKGETTVAKYNSETAPNHAHILQKLINENASTNTNTNKFYSGNIEPEEGTIFVFGSNPEGRHGAGAAKTAKEKFGAVQGQGEGLQGNAYALPTKDISSKDKGEWHGLAKDEIVTNIQKMYKTAEENPDKTFKVAYNQPLDKKSLNGYTGREMAEMFVEAGTAPKNVQFSEVWKDVISADATDITDYSALRQEIMNNYNEIARERAKESPDSDYYEYNKKGELFATRPTGVIRGLYDDVESYNTDLLKMSHLSMEELAARRNIADYRNVANNVVEAEAKLNEAKAGKAGTSADYETKINNLNQQAGEIYAKYLELTKDVEKEKFEAVKEKMSFNDAEEAYKKSYKNIDINEEYIKKTLSKEDYEKYTQALSDKQRADDFLNSDDANAVYQSSRHLYMKDGANPTGFYNLENAKGALGYDPEAEKISSEDEAAEINSKANKKQRRKMQEKIDKNQNKGSIHYKNQQAFEGLNYKDMDYNTRKYTLSSMLEYEKQFRDNLVNDGVIDSDAQILVDKKYLDLLQRVGKAGEGITNDKWNEKAIAGFINFTESTSGITKSIQDWQLAGGFSNINAASLAKIRSAIFNDPRAAKEYARIFSMAKNSNNVMKYVSERRQFLYDMTMAVHDQTVVTDMNGALSAQQGLDDFGTLQSLVGRVMGHMDGTIGVEGNSKVGRAWGRISDDMDALFSDPTFKNTLPLLRMRMLEINYDEAVRYINKNIDNIKQIDGMDEAAKAKYLKNLALKFSYAKTTDFFEPRKTRGEKFDEFFDNLFTEDERKVAASWTGAKRGDTLMDVSSNVFFALRWKMTFGGDVINGLTNTPGALIRKAKIASGNGDVNMMGKQFMRSGNTTGVGTIIALSALAMIWNRSLGYDSVDWDDLSPIGIDGEWQVPPILLKFQTIGQMLLPNDYDVTGEKGIGGFYINPNKQTVKTDPFFSMFTIGNSVARTVDFATNRNAYEYNNQRGLGFLGVNNPINQVLNNQVVEAVTDELLGANLLSPYKAMWEVLMDDTYYGNNIWEKKYLKDGSENPNYDPFRNTVASFAHILNWDWMLGGTNAWVKGYGSDNYENTGKIGSVGGSGIFQHEYVSAAINIIQGNALEGIVEAGELPLKFTKLTSSARTDFNVKVKNIITQYVDDYKRETGSDMNSVDATDGAYAKMVKKCADVVADWSAQNEYVLGQNQELVAYVTKALMCVCAGEYDDVANYVQGAYWKAQEITQIEHSQDLFLNDADLEQWIAEGKTQEEFTEEKNRRTKAYNQALDNEYQARIALKAAGISDEYLAGYAYEDYKAEQRSVNKAVFTEVMGVLESPVGEFDNFSELKSYYEEQIANTDNTTTKTKLAEKYNTILTDTLTPYINKYGGALIMADAYYDGKGLANSIADYVILPYGEKYYGKSPRANYLKDLFGVGYRDNSNMPSDKEVLELYNGAMKKISEGSTATANAMLERLLKQSRNGTTYMSSSDYSKVLKLKAHISAKGSYK